METGGYHGEAVIPSLSPSMDIQISSNFERLLFELYGHDADAIRQLMHQMKQSGGFDLSSDVHRELCESFLAARADDDHTSATIRQIYEATGEIIDPHTAVGIAAAQQHRAALDGAIVTLATAHPAKFPDAVKQAIGQEPNLPPHLSDLWQKEERFDVLPNDAEAVKQFIQTL